MATIIPRGKPIKVVPYKKPTRYTAPLNPVQKQEVTKKVKRAIARNNESDAIDTNVLSSPDAGGSIYKVVMPTQGDNVSQRDGDQIHLKAMYVRLAVALADSYNFTRLIFFRWSQNDSIAANVPTVSDVLQSVNYMAQYNYTSIESNKLHIISDYTYSLSDTGTRNVTFIQKFYGKKLGKKKVYFNAALTTGTDMIYMLFITDSVAASHPTIGGTIRVIYDD